MIYDKPPVVPVQVAQEKIGALLDTTAIVLSAYLVLAVVLVTLALLFWRDVKKGWGDPVLATIFTVCALALLAVIGAPLCLLL